MRLSGVLVPWAFQHELTGQAGQYDERAKREGTYYLLGQGYDDGSLYARQPVQGGTLRRRGCPSSGL